MQYNHRDCDRNNRDNHQSSLHRVLIQKNFDIQFVSFLNFFFEIRIPQVLQL